MSNLIKLRATMYDNSFAEAYVPKEWISIYKDLSYLFFVRTGVKSIGASIVNEED